jgi:two-component system, chemotaxis family, response regulator Rcp1
MSGASCARRSAQARNGERPVQGGPTVAVEVMDDVNAPMILLVEDNPGDVRLIKEALGESAHSARMEVARDGEEALEFLRGCETSRAGRLPDLTILDLNLPRKDGREVLAEMRADPRMRTVPVVVLSTSQADEDINRCYELGANCYINKPVEFERFIDVIRQMQHFWLRTVELPRRKSNESARYRSLAH